MSAVKGKDCWRNCGSNTKCLLVGCLHGCHPPELVGMAPFLALKWERQLPSSTSSCYLLPVRGRIQMKFLLPPICFQRDLHCNRKVQSYTNNLPYLPPGLFFRCATISPTKTTFLFIVKTLSWANSRESDCISSQGVCAEISLCRCAVLVQLLGSCP